MKRADIASQDFRDGVATGATRLVNRAITLMNWGVSVDRTVLLQLASEIRTEIGGVFTDTDEGGLR